MTLGELLDLFVPLVSSICQLGDDFLSVIRLRLREKQGKYEGSIQNTALGVRRLGKLDVLPALGKVEARLGCVEKRYLPFSVEERLKCYKLSVIRRPEAQPHGW